MQRPNKPSLLLYYGVAAAILAGSVFLIFDQEDFSLLFTLGSFDLFIITAIALVLYILSGIEYRWILQSQTGKTLSLFDVVTLPIVVNLWSFIIPFQGALVYSTLYLRFAYHATLSTGVATNLFSYLISIVVTGVVGIVFCAFATVPYPLFLTSIALCLAPLGIPLARMVSPHVPASAPFARRILTQINQLIGQLHSLLKDWRTMLFVFALNVIHTAVSTLWHAWIAWSLGMQVSLLAILMFTLFLRLSIVLKLTPGNLGVQELISGLVFSVFRLDPAHGVMISLIARVTSSILMLTVGVAVSAYHMKLFQIRRALQHDAAPQ